MNWFIRGKGAEGFIESDNLQDAFVLFVKSEPIETLGIILLGHTEYFPKDSTPPDAIGIRTTIPLVKAGIITEEVAKDINENICGKRIV